MLLKFFPKDRCLMERFLANHMRRVDSSESRPRQTGSLDYKIFDNLFQTPLVIFWLSTVVQKYMGTTIAPLSERSRLEMFGISAIQPSRIWEPPERSWKTTTTKAGRFKHWYYSSFQQADFSLHLCYSWNVFIYSYVSSVESKLLYRFQQ